MKRFVRNRFVDVLLNVILVMAILHIILLIALCLAKRDISYLNFFRILEIDAFFPYITQGPLSQIASLAIMAVLYLLMFFLYARKD
jgi:hypothetical protein